MVNENSTFILDTPSFQDLQSYLDVAINLPSTEAKFNEQFNKANFEIYLKDDKLLYKVTITPTGNNMELALTPTRHYRINLLKSANTAEHSRIV